MNASCGISTLPTIFIWGEGDPFALPETGKGIEKYVPDIKFHWVPAAGHQVRERPRELPAGLTGRELEVLLVLMRGASNQQIAADLGISVKTVGHHVQHVYQKAGVRSRAAATLRAFEQDLVHAAWEFRIGRSPDATRTAGRHTPLTIGVERRPSGRGMSRSPAH